jgi:imidazolonepropionase
LRTSTASTGRLSNTGAAGGRIPADFVVRHAGQLCTMVPRGQDPLGRIPDAAVAASEGLVAWVGPDRDLERVIRLDGDLVEAGGRCVLPGLVDPHTHPVFAGSRADEFAERVSGVTYAAQQRGERGIRRTVRATREASEDGLARLAVERAHRFLEHGTTTIEAKSGYGLDVEQERRQLRVLQRLAEQSALRVVPTLLAAHVVPDGVERADYVQMVIDEMLPALRPLAAYCDVWCDPPAFTAAETRTILGRARDLGYGLRVHAAQVAPGEGPSIAAELKAASADHLEYATREQVAALAMAGTMAVLCPGANFTVPNSPRPPIEAFREHGFKVALASDCNPGTCNSESLTFAMTLACVEWGLTPVEALVAATVNSARSLGLEGRAGVLTPGAAADLCVFDVGAPEDIPYHVGVNRAVMTITGGRIWTAP